MTYHSLLPSLPDDALVWIYPTKAPVGVEVGTQLLARIRAFMSGWRSHGRATRGNVAIVHERFIVAAGSLSPGGQLSGCSIDSLTRTVTSTAQEMGIVLLSPVTVFYRGADDLVHSASRGAFRRMAQRRAVHAETPVFDLGLTSVGALRSGAFELPMRDSWHARVFRRALAAAPLKADQ